METHGKKPSFQKKQVQVKLKSVTPLSPSFPIIDQCIKKPSERNCRTLLKLNNPADNYFNTEISHEQIFYEDGKQPTNEGFFGDSKVRPDNPNNLSKYEMFGPHYDDATMREAAKAVKRDMKPYCLIGNNCQDFADKVRKEYERRRPKACYK